MTNKLWVLGTEALLFRIWLAPRMLAVHYIHYTRMHDLTCKS